MAETTLNKKMRAFDDEVALTVAPFYLVHMLQRTLPTGFIAPCLSTEHRKPTHDFSGSNRAGVIVVS
jgi:hypothetical protein